MKIIKKIIVFVLIFLICRGIYVYSKDNESKVIPDFAGFHFERNTKENIENLYFGKDGSFIYTYEDGKSVGDYDLCSEYSYDKSNKIIKLKCSRDAKKVDKKIKVIKYKDDKISLEINDKKINFTQKIEIK